MKTTILAALLLALPFRHASAQAFPAGMDVQAPAEPLLVQEPTYNMLEFLFHTSGMPSVLDLKGKLFEVECLFSSGEKTRFLFKFHAYRNRAENLAPVRMCACPYDLQGKARSKCLSPSESSKVVVQSSGDLQSYFKVGHSLLLAKVHQTSSSTARLTQKELLLSIHIVDMDKTSMHPDKERYCSAYEYEGPIQ